MYPVYCNESLYKKIKSHPGSYGCFKGWFENTYIEIGPYRKGPIYCEFLFSFFLIGKSFDIKNLHVILKGIKIE